MYSVYITVEISYSVDLYSVKAYSVDSSQCVAVLDCIRQLNTVYTVLIELPI